MCETIFKVSYMYFLVFLPFPLLINIHIFEISEMTTHPTTVSSIYIWSKNFSHSAHVKSEAKDGGH